MKISVYTTVFAKTMEYACFYEIQAKTLNNKISIEVYKKVGENAIIC